MTSPTDLDAVLELLRKIELNQRRANTFYVGTAIAVAIGTAFGFVMSLALNDAFTKTFKLIKVGDDGVLGAWIYAIIAIILFPILMFLVYRYLQPALHCSIDKIC